MKIETHNKRIFNLRKFIEENKAEAYFTSLLPEIYYLTGAQVEGHLFVSKEELKLFTNKLYIEDARKEAKNVEVICPETDYYRELRDFLKTKKQVKCLISLRESVETYLLLRKAGLKIKSVDSQKIRIIKDEEEIKKIKKAYSIIESAITESLKFVKEGMSELDLKAEIVYWIRRFGGSSDSFDHIVVFGEKSSVPHAKSGNRKLKFGDLILIDAGAKYEGYCSDITRCFLFGKKDGEMDRLYNFLLSAVKAAEEKLAIGESLRNVDKAARKFLKKHNLERYFTHGLGHGVGLEIHEAPVLSPKSKEKLENGMVFTIEPGIYFEGKFGLRLENGYAFFEKPLKFTKLSEKLEVI